MTLKPITSQQAASNSIELSLEQLIACQYWARDSIPLPNKKSKAHLVGGHLSPYKGRGMEFSEVRQYQPGDDIRTIDWKVTARTGEVHTKIFQEERERPVFLLVDLQDSMFFGSKKRFKSTLACLQAARVFWTAHNSGNRVGALLSTAEEHVELKPSNRRQNGLRLLQHMLELHNQRLQSIYQQEKPFTINSNALSDALSRLRHLVKGGSLIYIFSDFTNLSESCKQDLINLAQHNDIHTVMITDPLEQTIPVAGEFIVSDGDNTIALNSARPGFKSRYQEMFHDKLIKTKKFFHEAQCSFVEYSTAQELSDFAINPYRHRSASNKRA
ncbi:MAG: DUF58 domain-containing protein [Kangiella sp.]|jgi:uncharacterized protein (DUF58 family)|nr:DUF58 domain-containing protein [Kangiella sp.]MCW9027346.1 DUF58 domain-containing protein [Kangiella sp.]